MMAAILLQCTLAIVLAVGVRVGATIVVVRVGAAIVVVIIVGRVRNRWL